MSFRSQLDDWCGINGDDLKFVIFCIQSGGMINDIINNVIWIISMGKCIIQYRQSIPKIKVHIISKVITHNISLTSNYF